MPESDVIKALGELLTTGVNYDVIIYIGEMPDFKEFHLHANILCCRSRYFNSILSAKDVEKRDGKYVIKKPDITPKTFDIIANYLYTGQIDLNNKTCNELLAITIASNELKLQLPKFSEDFNFENNLQFLQNDIAPQTLYNILKYLYTGQIDITNKTGNELLDIMIVSDRLNMKQLTKLTEDFLSRNHQELLRNDPAGILRIVYYQHTSNSIREVCLETICSEPELLFDFAEFINLPAPLLEVILKRDDLNLDEIKVWENLIKWGLAQEEKILNKDVSEWNQDEFNVFERILHKFIPLIRFYEISSDDYVNKIRPYEEILPNELRNDIYKFHMASGYEPILNKHSPRCPKSKQGAFRQSEIQYGNMIFFQNASTGNEISKQITADQIFISNDFWVGSLIVKVVTVEIFKKHRGLDLFNIEDAFFKLHLCGVSKNKSYSTFKKNISQYLKISNKQVRFWVFSRRENKTFRPNHPIPEYFANRSMKDICTTYCKNDELNLYMEVASKPFNDESWFPSLEVNNYVFIFLKYFDPDAQTLVGLGHLYVSKFRKVSDYIHVLYEKKNFPPNTPLEIYEEIRPNMIEKMKLHASFQGSEIQHGDIICFQKALIEKEIQRHKAAGRVYNIPQFYAKIGRS